MDAYLACYLLFFRHLLPTHAASSSIGAAFYYDRSEAPYFEAHEVRAYGLLLQGLLRQLDIGFEGGFE